MNKKWLYIITRKDLSPSQIAVQSIHAAFELGRHSSPNETHPSVVLMKVKNELELIGLKDYLNCVGLNFKEFVEPFYNNSITSISVEPITMEQRTIFKRLKLMRDSDFSLPEVINE